jgi:hypothetical protein
MPFLFYIFVEQYPVRKKAMIAARDLNMANGIRLSKGKF